ncbi:MAG: PaaI family thioesterase [Elusimicrobia bacterium]|nr:PaaI family thioesterase [Elusimicrobiota bacterium]
MRPPTFKAKKGWIPVDPFRQIATERGFIPSDGSDRRLMIRYFKRKSGPGLTARVWFGPDSEGPPRHAHGGAVAAVLDEVLGAAAWVMGLAVMTARLTVKFRKAVPLGTKAVVETHVRRAGKLRVVVSGKLTDESGRVCAEGEGLFLKVPDALWRRGKAKGGLP